MYFSNSGMTHYISVFLLYFWCSKYYKIKCIFRHYIQEKGNMSRANIYKIGQVIQMNK